MRTAQLVLVSWLLAVGPVWASAQTQPVPPVQAAPAPAGKPDALQKIREDAAALRPLVESDLARAFLDAAQALPPPAPRSIYVHPETKAIYTKAQADSLPEAERAVLKERVVDAGLYYNTKYGSPLAYARALDLIARSQADPPLTSLTGKRVLDYGYGTIGHLRLLGTLGCHATGVDVDPLLPALYSDPADQGEVAGTHPPGSVAIVHGRFPADETTRAAVASRAGNGNGGSGYDLIISKNTLKNGYLHPAQPVDKRMLVDLGVEEEAFVRSLHDALKPGGVVMIYNLSPAPSKEGEPYKPWSDSRCPFPRAMLEAAGFTVLAFDADDHDAARAMGRALGWDAAGTDLENDLFAHYTLVQRPAGR